MNRIYISVCVASLLCTSCFKDLGNYEYRQVEDFKIDNIESSYNVFSYVENLKITPVVTPETGDYEYEWFVTRYKQSSHGQVEKYAETISREKELDCPFNYPTGEYELHLKVTSRSSGDAEYVRMTVNAITPYTNACFVLYEMSDGNSEMDIHYQDLPSEIKAVYDATGESLKGKPKFLGYMPRYAYLDEDSGEKVFNTLIIPASEQSIVTFNTTDMSVARNGEQWFYDTYDAKQINCMLYHGFSGFIFADTGVHTVYQDYQGEHGKPSTGKFSAVPDILDGVTSYEVSSEICHLGDNIYFFDNVSRQFVVMDYNATPGFYDLLIPSSLPGVLGTPQPVDGDVIFIGGIITTVATDTRAPKYLFIITEKDGQRKWYHVRSAYERLPEATPPYMYIVGTGEFTDDSPFSDAAFFTTSKSGANYVYAAAKDGNFYYLDINDGYKVKPMTFTSQPAGEVTYFQTMYELTEGTSAETDYNCFVVATYLEGQYTVAFYDMIGGLPIKGAGPSKCYKGEGKVKSIQVASQTKKPGVLGHGNITTRYSLHY